MGLRLAILLEGIDESGSAHIEMLPAQRLKAVQGPIAFLDQILGCPEHGLLAGGILGRTAGLVDNVPKRGEDEFGDMIHHLLNINPATTGTHASRATVFDGRRPLVPATTQVL
ncbi:hypothetical protein DCS_00529 [Drechmeria coniospora]|uniref:Uncharacterized protein n=1 Tax=Drechmeria coniospora TaxID=98403 RepID=A0A151GQM0_DRECN|nr:hypothetical protein DCS_00529 [Drechmeria coniospora]KYK59399.1 hypothetical protein DCS_00529 [Drechmeria coniospora]